MILGLLAGSRVGSVQANDIDSHPHLIYSLEPEGNPGHAFRYVVIVPSCSAIIE